MGATEIILEEVMLAFAEFMKIGSEKPDDSKN
jgi:hypothetical protein